MGNILITCLLLFFFISSISGSVIVENEEEKFHEQVNKLSTLIEKFSALYLTSFEQKISAITNALNQVDSNIRGLHEKSGTWNIFLHHIQAWTDTMKAIDHKVDLVKLSQDETDNLENKLNSMEFTINHILTKMDSLNEKSRTANSVALEKMDNIYRVVHNMELADGDSKKELSSKLTTLMRHILNIEGNVSREPRRAKVSRGAIHEGEYYNQNLESIENKIDRVLEELPAVRDLGEIVSTQRKNSESITNMLELIQAIDERTVRLYDSEAQHSSKLLSCCRQSSDELATFTMSSDLLLKRIEKLVTDVQSQVKKFSLGKKEDSGDNVGRSSGVDGNQNTDDSSIDKSESGQASNATNSINTDSQKPNNKDEDERTERVDVDRGENRSPESKVDENSAVDDPSDGDEIEEVPESRQGIKELPHKSGCHEVEERVDGVYRFRNASDSEFRNFYERYCAFPTDGLGWTVVQRRGPFELQENFNRSWDDYKQGFGDITRDFWFGNEFIHRLVYKDIHELRIEMEDFEGVKVWTEYSTFQIEPEKYNYKLMIGGFRGSVTDSMLYHDGMEFSTYDRRNDRTVDKCCPCATGYGSGWWFDNCSEANLNGLYRDKPNDHNYIGIVWENWHGDYSLKRTRMLIRPKNIWHDDEVDDDQAFPEIPPEDP